MRMLTQPTCTLHLPSQTKQAADQSLYPALGVALQLSALSSTLCVGRALGFSLRRLIWSTLLLSLCPFLWFLSQKFWLDNLLVATSPLALALHLHSLSRPESSYAPILSGVGLALAYHSKLTSILLAPALLAATYLLPQKPSFR